MIRYNPRIRHCELFTPTDRQGSSTTQKVLPLFLPLLYNSIRVDDLRIMVPVVFNSKTTSFDKLVFKVDSVLFHTQREVGGKGVYKGLIYVVLT